MKAYVKLMSEEVLGERLAPDEATTTIALQHALPVSFSREGYTWDAVENWTMSMIRTGAIYVIERDQLEPAWNTLWDVPVTELPPLPFPRLGIEAEVDGKPCMFATNEKDGHNIEFKMIVVYEVVQGQEWNICFVLNQRGEQNYFAFGCRTDDQGINILFPLAMWDEYKKSYPDDAVVQSQFRIFAGLLLRYIVNTIHLISARNTPKERLDLPRPQRRQFKQRYNIEHPTVYRVKLSQAGEAEGVGGWHYKVRFLVCGHWRHYSSGARSWVKPYIKGPPGAPWKGRPVHVKEEDG